MSPLPNNKYVLWLPSWYPNREDAFTGDFIERHALAASLYTPIEVLVLAGTQEKEAIELVQVNENLRVHYCYIPHRPGGVLPLFVKKWMAYRKLIAQLFRERGVPALVHVHVATWAGAYALWLKQKHRLPFLLTEHWSGFMKTVPHTVYRFPGLLKALLRRIITRSSMVQPVSAFLGREIEAFARVPNMQIVRNVVDTKLFYYEPQLEGSFTFVHVSGFGHPKNPQGLLRGFSGFLENGGDAWLELIGPAKQELLDWVQAYIPEAHRARIRWMGELPYPEVAARVRQAHASVLFSHYETLSCVILEALCCGKPVLATRVGGIPEIVDAENGILVEDDDVAGLAAGFKEMQEQYHRFNPAMISVNATGAYAYEVIGRQISSLYDEIE
jgi:glycosyltransferase involved in cell wall biosynthesis